MGFFHGFVLLPIILSMYTPKKRGFVVSSQYKSLNNK